MKRCCIIVGILSVAASTATARDLDSCIENADLQAKFTACNELLAAEDLEAAEKARLFAARATAYRAIGDTENAIEDLNQSVTLDPEFAEAFIMRGAAKQDIGNLKSAVSDYDRALALTPDDPTVISNRATAFCALGDAEAADADWLAVINQGFWPAQEAQAWLKDSGFYSGAIDGQFGPQSKRALDAWIANGCP